MTTRFRAGFPEGSAHWVQVIIHPTLHALRRHLGERTKDSDIVSGCLTITPPVDGLIAEVHLCRTHLACEYVLHECVHSAWHQAELLEIRPQDRFQEHIAYGTADLASQIAAYLTDEKAQIHPPAPPIPGTVCPAFGQPIQRPARRRKRK